MQAWFALYFIEPHFKGGQTALQRQFLSKNGITYFRNGIEKAEVSGTKVPAPLVGQPKKRKMSRSLKI